MNFGSNGISGRVLLYFTLHTNSDLKRQILKLTFHNFNYMQQGGGGWGGGGYLLCVQLASYLDGGPLMWMKPLYLHVNQKSDYDYDKC